MPRHNTSLIKKNAAIAKAQADRDIAIAQAEADRESNEARGPAGTQIAQKQTELGILLPLVEGGLGLLLQAVAFRVRLGPDFRLQLLLFHLDLVLLQLGLPGRSRRY